ncbi:hypothetical protein BCF11_4867 [Collimonas sp. PA-H2]|uniref:hypothetical protein n=1 Tax=Collimonas sp. PA-H2 TaxID=1881062 RepID=UPI000BF643FB|nr:hypothetical protein [Collimonas sp. PA-H2]PFH12386.1 hypothetical protein BCF11_4867 [Collimonas sp. PA-H2]
MDYRDFPFNPTDPTICSISPIVVIYDATSMEKDQQLRQINIQTVRVKLGLVSKTAIIHEFPRRVLPYKNAI